MGTKVRLIVSEREVMTVSLRASLLSYKL
jgi:hypothetical protein